MYYLNSRYYNPEIGRFINADGLIGPVGGILTHNMYAYGLNNPVMMVDPSGLLANWLKTTIKVGIAVVTIAAVSAVIVGSCGSAGIAAAPILYSAVVGGIASTGANIAGQKISGKEWKDIDWGEAALSGAGGFVVGATSVASGPIGMHVFFGGSVSTLVTTLDSKIDGEEITMQDVGMSFASGAIGSYVGGKYGGNLYQYGNIFDPLSQTGNHILKWGLKSNIVGVGTSNIFGYLFGDNDSAKKANRIDCVQPTSVGTF